MGKCCDWVLIQPQYFSRCQVHIFKVFPRRKKITWKATFDREWSVSVLFVNHKKIFNTFCTRVSLLTPETSIFISSPLQPIPCESRTLLAWKIKWLTFTDNMAHVKMRQINPNAHDYCVPVSLHFYPLCCFTCVLELSQSYLKFLLLNQYQQLENVKSIVFIFSHQNFGFRLPQKLGQFRFPVILMIFARSTLLISGKAWGLSWLSSWRIGNSTSRWCNAWIRVRTEWRRMRCWPGCRLRRMRRNFKIVCAGYAKIKQIFKNGKKFIVNAF